MVDIKVKSSRNVLLLNERRRIILAAIAPCIIMSLLLVIGWMTGLIRYSPSFFTEDFVQRYQTPSSVLEKVEKVIQQGDVQMAKEVQGVRWLPHKIKPIPNFQFSLFWHKDKKYQDYLFFDISNYDRYVVHIKMVDGRFVWVPETLYYYVDSGRWIRTFYPILTVWWLILFLFIITRLVYLALTGFKPEKVVQRDTKR